MIPPFADRFGQIACDLITASLGKVTDLPIRHGFD